MTTHINSKVSMKTRDSMDTITALISDDFISDRNHNSANGCANIIPIDDDRYSCFGGYKVNEIYHQSSDPSYSLIPSQIEHNYKMEDVSYKDFKQWNNIDFDSDIPEELKEEFYEFQDNYFEPAVFEFEITIDNNLNVDMQVYLRYKDSPYYRYAETIIDITVSEYQFRLYTPEFWVKVITTLYENKVNRLFKEYHAKQ